MAVVGHDGLIRDIRAGNVPTADKLFALFEQLQISFTIGEDGIRSDANSQFARDVAETLGLASTSSHDDILAKIASLTSGKTDVVTRSDLESAVRSAVRAELSSFIGAEEEPRSSIDEVEELRLLARELRLQAKASGRDVGPQKLLQEFLATVRERDHQ